MNTIPADIQKDAYDLYPIEKRLFIGHPSPHDIFKKDRDNYIKGRTDERNKTNLPELREKAVIEAKQLYSTVMCTSINENINIEATRDGFLMGADFIINELTNEPITIPVPR